LEAAPGAGIVSAFILQSDDLDEIDWEWLGGTTTNVQSNYFSKGVANYGNGGVHNVANPQTTYHSMSKCPAVLIVAYVIDWSPTQIEWLIDGVVVRTVTAATAGSAYPQTPSQVRVGTWCGGCSGSPAGTVTWSGGPTTFSGAPYVMTIQSLEIVNTNPASSYTYGDMSGTAGSIKGSSSVVSVSSVASATSASASGSASGTSAATKSSSGSASKPSGSASASGAGSGNQASGAGSGSGAGAQTGLAGPTSNNLAAASSANKLSLGGVVALVFGAIILVA
jgi:beta-glucanase (GH16 family)